MKWGNVLHNYLCCHTYYFLLYNEKPDEKPKKKPNRTVATLGRMLTLDDAQFQIFNELQGKLQDILRAVKALVPARKKGQAMVSNADKMENHFLWSDFIRDYVALQIGHLRANLPFLRPIQTELLFFEASPNKF